MGKFKIFFILVLLFFTSISCRKVKLEDDERGRQLLGRWTFSYAGKFDQSGNFLDWTGQIYPFKNYIIEFNEDAEFSIYDDNSILNYDVISTTPLDESYSFGAIWNQQIGYENKIENGGVKILYFGDSIIVNIIPYDMYTQYNSSGGNVFYRIQ